MSYFGEISEPSTRTAWEDWDDALDNENFPKLHLQNNMSTPPEINTFLILEGRFLFNCIRAQSHLEHVDSIPAVNLHLYKTPTLNNYVCIIKDYNIVQSSEIVELLKGYITKSNDVVALLTKPIVEYQSAQLITKDYLVRSLFTSKQVKRKPQFDFPHLEQPNIVAGVSAGAICLREVLDKPAAALVYYIEHPEDQELMELQELLQDFQVISQIKKMKGSNILNSNLYI